MGGLKQTIKGKNIKGGDGGRSILGRGGRGGGSVAEIGILKKITLERTAQKFSREEREVRSVLVAQP